MRETKAAKASRISMLAADYDEKSRTLRKLIKDVEALKTQIRETVEPGTYGEWVIGTGTPRELFDQPAAKDALTAAGIPIPTKMSAAPITVTHVAATK